MGKVRAAVAVVVVLCALLTAACREQKQVTAEPRPKEALVAIINGHEIPAATFDDYLQLNELASEARDSESRRAIFEEFVVEQLLIQAAAREKIELGDEEVRLYLEEWQKAAGEAGEPEPQRLREYLRSQKLIRQKISQHVQVTKEEMERYYTDHKVDFVVDDQVHVLEILVDQEQKAGDIRSKLRPRDFRGFRNLARQHSQGISAKDGGDLGTFERGQLPEEFERVIFSLKPGGVSQVFRSEHGYHIFMLEEFIPRHPQLFHEVQTQIFENLIGEREREATDRYLAQLKKQASIEVLDPNLKVNWRDDNASN